MFVLRQARGLFLRGKARRAMGAAFPVAKIFKEGTREPLDHGDEQRDDGHDDEDDIGDLGMIEMKDRHDAGAGETDQGHGQDHPQDCLQQIEWRP